MTDKLTRRYLLAVSAGSFLAVVVSLMGQLYYYNNGNAFPLSPSVNVITQEFNQYMMLQEFINLERLFLILGVAVLILSFSFPILRARKRLVSYMLIGFSAVYFNLLYLWTSTVFNSSWIQYSNTIIRLLISEGSIFKVLNIFTPVPSSNILGVGPFIVADYVSVALLFITFLSVLYAFGFANAIIAISLLVIPLPIEIFLFDRLEFNIYVIGAFSSNPILDHFTNSTLLVLCVSGLVMSTVWMNKRKAGSTIRSSRKIEKGSLSNS